MAIKKKLKRATGKGLKSAFKATPVGGAVSGVYGGLKGGKGTMAAVASGGGVVYRRRRTRGMYLRKGRLFMGFSQKEVKNAMRRSYGGRRKGK